MEDYHQESYVAYQMAAMAVTLNDLEGHSQIVGLFKCNAFEHFVEHSAFYTISTDSICSRGPFTYS